MWIWTKEHGRIGLRQFQTLYANKNNTFYASVAKIIRQWNSNKNKFHFYTSGTTGKPKKVIHHRNKITQSALSSIRHFEFMKGQNVLLALNPEHIGGFMLVVRALIAKCNILLIEPSKETLSQIPTDFRINFISLSSSQIHNKKIPENVDKILIGGGEVDENRIYFHDSVKIYQSFGMTETLSHFAIRNIDLGTKYFTCLPEFKIKVDTENRIQVYSRKITKKWIKTNDIVESIDDKSFKWLGRYDNIINSGGIKINPEYLEKLIHSNLFINNHIDEYFISSIPDKIYIQKCVLIIKNERKLTQEIKSEILLQLKIIAPKYWIPKEIIEIPNFIYTKNNKINRKATTNLIN